MVSSQSSPPVVVITGPTAVGKSDLALRVASRLDAEIVSADSRQVYRYLDVGTAKPTVAERAAVPHHLIDVAYPDEPYSVATYQRAAGRAIAEIAARGRLALVVGGSPHYIQAVVDRLQPPPADLRLRAWLERVDRLATGRARGPSPPPSPAAAGEGVVGGPSPPPSLVAAGKGVGSGGGRLDAWLRALDPASAEAIDPRNRRRVMRAVEATLTSGRRFSEAGRQRGPSLPAVWIGLRRDRTSLHERVARRAAAMLREGWIDEVRALLAMGYPSSLPSMSATGYAELARTLRGEVGLEEAMRRVRLATHAFIRRQETWLRAEPRIQWFDAADPDLASQVLAAIRLRTED